jgi:DNA-binding IclR family transcriptional regulator
MAKILKKTSSPSKAASRPAVVAMVSTSEKKKKKFDLQDDDQYFSRAVGKAFLLLNNLNGSKSPVSLSEISSSIGLSKSSSFRLLHTLERLKYINQSEDGRYTIAASSWVTPSMQVANMLEHSSLAPAMALHDEFRETVSVSVLFTNHIEVVRVFESTYIVRMANTVGRILPPHASSMGKAITAFQTEDVCRKLLLSYGLARFTPTTITDEAILMKEFDGIRKDKFAQEAEESTPDGCCFGAPIFLGGPSAVAAISISMPKSRVPLEEGRIHMITRLQEAAKAISIELSTAVDEQFEQSHEPSQK